jgi:hypothetical protein
VNAAPDDINANENADAPKTKARECLTPKAILPQPVVLSSWVWLAGAAVMAAACWLTIFATGHPRSYRVHLGYAALRERSTMTRRTLYRL